MKSFSLRPVIISAFGPPALACIRSWGRSGMSPGMICILEEGDNAPASKFLSSFVCLPRNDLHTEQGLRAILGFLIKFKASGVACIDENIARWLNDQRVNIPEEIYFWLPPNTMLENVLDKAVQIEAARRTGLTVLPTYLFSDLEDAEKVAPEDFPICLRPSISGGTSPSFKAKNINSLLELQTFLLSHKIREPIIGQPFKKLPNLVVHGSRLINGETMGLQGFLVERKFEGVTLTIRPVSLEDEFKEQCIAFTEIMDLVGPYHFEFLFNKDHKDYYFLEINHRFGGTTSKVLACGYDEPAYALQAYGIDIPITETIKNITVSNIKALVKSSLYALTGRLTSLDYPEESKVHRVWFTLKSLILCKDEIFAWDDLQGTIAFYLGKYKFMQLLTKK